MRTRVCQQYRMVGRISLFIASLAVLTAIPRPVQAWNPLAGDFSKSEPTAIRVMAYNVQLQFIEVPEKDAAFARILTAVSPDIISFEEMPTGISASELGTRLDAILPLPGSATWQVQLGKSGGSRTAIVSKYPLTLKRTDTSPVAGTRGVNIALANLPSGYNVDLYLMSVHLKCCYTDGSEDEDRQRSADAIAAWMGDARQAGGSITLPANTPMVVLGDFNLVGGPQPGTTLLTGDIIDNATFGPDVKGDWDVSNISDLMPRNPTNNDADTYPSTGSPSSRLDRFMYTDSVVTVSQSMVLNTLTMSTAARNAAGLQSSDTTQASTSDHLPIFADFNVPHFIDCNQNLVDDLLDIANQTSEDCDLNSVPDECDTDTDSDGAIDACDNCPAVANPDQVDTNTNGVGDACEAPFITSLVSRKTVFDLDLLHGLARPEGIECRHGGPTTLVATFSVPIQGVGGLDLNDVLVTMGQVTDLAIAGSQLTIQLTGVADRNTLMLAYPGIEAAAQPGQTSPSISCFGVLKGDVTGDGSVNVFDLVGARNVLNQTTTAGNFRSDVSGDGVINILDLVAIRNNLNASVAACP